MNRFRIQSLTVLVPKNVVRNLIIISLMMVSGLSQTYSQEILVKAELDTTLMLIGDQQKYRLIAEQPKQLELAFPLFGDTLLKNVEILDRSTDTLFLSNTRIRVTQEYLITSFDSGYYEIPKQPVLVKGQGINDTLFSNSYLFYVNTFQIDTVKGIVDIKPPMEAPLIFREVLPWLVYGLLLAAILVAAWWVYRKYFKKGEMQFIPYKAEIPAHVEALDALDALKNKKLWQQGLVKEYHSELSDIFRRYLERRFHFPAMEQTTDEILSVLESTRHTDSMQYEIIREVLVLADFVKFAKLEPLAAQNESSFQQIYSLVIQTKQESVLYEDKDKSPSDYLKHESHES